MNTETKKQNYAVFYKAKGNWMDYLIRFVTRSNYSHCEIAVPDETAKGVYFCFSASNRDKGVRMKRMRLPKSRWDFVKITTDEATIRQRFVRTVNSGYDYKGVFRFLLSCIKQNPKKWFCSELDAYLIGLNNPHKYTPGSLHHFLKKRQQKSK